MRGDLHSADLHRESRRRSADSQTGRVNPNENGDAEQSHHRFKRACEAGAVGARKPRLWASGRECTISQGESGCGYRRKLERALAQAGVTPKSVVEFASVEAIKQCAVLGMGIAHLPAITVAA